MPIATSLPDILEEKTTTSGWWGLASRHPTIFIGATLLASLVFVACAAPLLGTVDPSAISPLDRTLAPSSEHWFGTDLLGRDVYSRVLYGARVSLAVGFSTAALASAFGLLLGLIAGYVRWTDGLIMRVMDSVMSVPSILLAIALLSVTSGSLGSVIFAITVAEIPRVARLIRGQVLALRGMPYVEAAMTSGTRTPAIMARHILPNVVAPLTVQTTYICAAAILVEASLSFVGAGLPPTTPSWGNIMAEGRSIWQVKPYIIFFPALMLSITVLAVNIIGDGLRDLLDPRSAGRM
ncbi:MAG: ABC transporter permease [Ferrovibrionaceae bacterium]